MYKVKTHTTKLKAGDAGIKQTIEVMKRFALKDSTTREIVDLARKYKRSSDVLTVEALFTYVHSKHQYKSDPEDAELVIAPRHMVTRREHRKGDCDDLSTLLASLLIAAGFKVAYKTIAWRRYEYTHVYCLVYLPSQEGWIPLDPVMKKKGFGSEKAPIIRTKIWGINT